MSADGTPADPRPRIALTFDDGPAPWTVPILDLLAEHRVPATFFLIGSLVDGREDVVTRIVAEGHEIGNHSWSHPRLAETCDDERVFEELRSTNEALAQVVGFAPARFRAPQYDTDARVEAVAARLSLVHTPGDVRPPDWLPACTGAFITTFVLRQLSPGSVVGLHDGVPPHKVGRASRQPTVDAVGQLLPRIQAAGFECVRASELLGSGPSARPEAPVVA